MRTWLVFILFLATAAAGCLGGDDLDDPDIDGTNKKNKDPGELNLKPAEETDLEQALEAIEIVDPDDPEYDQPNVTMQDWLLLSVPTSDAGEIAVFQWEIPEHAINADDEILLDVAVALDPMGHPEGLPEGMDWLFMMVTQRYDEDWAEWQAYTTQDWIHTGITKHRDTQRIDGDSQESTSPPSSSPVRLRLKYDEELYNRTVYFVLAARGPSDAEFGMGVRMLESGRQSSNWADFQEAIDEGKAPLAPKRVHSGTGLYLAEYHEVHVVGDRNARMITDDGPVPNDSFSDAWYPYTSTRSVSFNSGTDWGGWSDLRVVYVSGVEYGQMSIEADLHGETESRSYQFFGHFVPDGFTPLVDPPVVRMTVDGPSSSNVDVELTKSGTLISEELAFRHYSIGVQLQEVTGLPYRDFSMST